MAGNDEFTIDLKKIKNLKSIRYEYVFLFLFLVVGFYLRAYHIDYPAIGYHNMKENEYIGSAKFMFYEGEDYLHRKLYRMGAQDIPYFEEYPQMPIIQWSSVILWKIFGMHLWLVRLLMILASVASIYVMYLLIFELSKSKYLALLSSFFMAVFPLGIFFGRNIQPESPALLFLLLGMLYYVRWLESFSRKDAFYLGLYLGISGLFKYTFLIGAIPLFFIFPFSKLKEKGFAGKLKSSALPVIAGVSPMIIWSLIAPLLNRLSTITEGTFGRIDLFRVFTVEYWQARWPSFNNYIGDNYTWWFFWTAVFGIMLVSLSMKDKKMTYLSLAGILFAGVARFSAQGSPTFVLSFFAIFAIIVANAVLSLKHKRRFQAFVLFYAAAIIPYSMILSDYIPGHNYYQMPFLPLIALLSAYAIYSAGNLLKQVTKIKFIELLPLVLILFTIQDISAHKDAMFNTQFFGLDIGGEYLKSNMMQGERFVMFGHSQSVAVCVYAERLCAGVGSADDLTEFETKRGTRWIFIDNGAGMALLQGNPELMRYIESNYDLSAIGLLRTGQGFSLHTIILRKGGSFSFSNISEHPVVKSQKVIAQKNYELTKGNIEYYLIG